MYGSFHETFFLLFLELFLSSVSFMFILRYLPSYGTLPFQFETQQTLPEDRTLCYFAEVGTLLVLVVRMFSMIFGERDIPEHLIFCFGAAGLYLTMGTMRIYGATKACDESDSSEYFDDLGQEELRELKEHSFFVGCIEILLSGVSLVDAILRVANPERPLLHSNKSIFKLPSSLLIPELVLSTTVFVLFLSAGPPDAIRQRLLQTQRAGRVQRLKKFLLFPVMVNPFFMYVCAVLIISVPWADKDNIMNALFSLVIGTVYLSLGCLHVYHELCTQARNDQVSLLGLAPVFCGVVYVMCSSTFLHYQTHVVHEEAEDSWTKA